MTHPILSRIPWLRQFVDERFLDHRRRSSSTAGFAALFAALCFFEYHIFAQHFISWELIAIMATFAIVKTTSFFWYRSRN